MPRGLGFCCSGRGDVATAGSVISTTTVLADHELDHGDALLVYSDGLVDARADLCLDRQAVAEGVGPTTSAAEAVERLVELADPRGPLPDDLTLMVLRCR